MGELLTLPFFQRAVVAGILASLACGVVGTFVVVKRIASISGGLSHAAFGGVGLGYLLHFNQLLGAAIFALVCGAGMTFAHRKMHDGFDTLIAMMWSVGMALGIVFVSLTPGYAPDLMTYLFGNILFVPGGYVYAVAALDVLIVAVVLLFYKDLQAIAFEEEFTEVVGVPVTFLFHVLMALIALTVVILIRVVGVILVIALLTIPAATARQWSMRLPSMMVTAVCVGALCTVSGLVISALVSETARINMPTGPTIILFAAALFSLSSIARFARHKNQ